MDPILVTIAGALVKEAVKPAVAALVKRVRAKFGKGTAEEDVLEAALESPDNEKAVQRLANRLAEAERSDPEFGGELRELWETAKVEITLAQNTQVASSGGVNNSITGTVHGKVVQARDITGGITFH
ncbi:hypothetical protein GCM10010174_64080 [Kutzneria viridogrisea]|uniref:Uncharacterized protein n=2 Tax=Kutzneria TaxID=43356 RepID=W5WQP6_9PSEU|nr:hypothetical protein [Kutzneria albida]AHI00505.1 hypothetical protein KALB_7147 [Kutzneria albida DSM 43870]MBA8925684.1 hypothetical protein [Kutzneria viridogrisea]